MEIADFRLSKHIEIAMYCLVALGHPFECEWTDCVFESREFTDEVVGTRPTIDHILPRSQGGPNTPDNLRFAHWKCNVGGATRGKTIPGRRLRSPSDETRAKIGEGVRRFYAETPLDQRKKRKVSPLSAEHRQKIGDAHRGRVKGPLSEAHKQKLREAAKRRRSA